MADNLLRTHDATRQRNRRRNMQDPLRSAALHGFILVDVRAPLTLQVDALATYEASWAATTA